MSKAELESVICDLLKALQRFPRHTGMIDRCHFTRQTVISVFRVIPSRSCVDESVNVCV